MIFSLGNQTFLTIYTHSSKEYFSGETTVLDAKFFVYQGLL